MNRRRWLALGAAATASACAPRPGASRLRIGYQKSGVLLLAKARGLDFRGARPALEWTEFPAGPPLLEAMNAGAVDFGATGDAPPIFAQASGAPIRYVAVQPVSGEYQGVVVPPGSPLRQGADLRGKRIAVTRASSGHAFLVRALGSVGLSLTEVTPVFLTPADAAGAFSSGSIDAWAPWDPYLAIAQKTQGARVLISGASLPSPDAFFLASDRLVAEAPDLVRSLLDALAVQAAWGQAHHTEMVAIMAAGTGLPTDIVETSLRRGPLKVDPVTPDVLARQQATADVFSDLKIIPRRIRVADAAWTGWTPAA